MSDIRDRTGWDLRVSADLAELPPPTEAELTALRGLLATMPAGARLKPAAVAASQAPNGSAR